MELALKREHPALTDPQTGLPNALHWETVFGVVFAAGGRRIPLTLIIMEIDEFQGWAAEKPHEDVEQAFGTLGSLMSNATRQTDLMARLEESRFAFGLLDCDLNGGRLVADRLDSLLRPVGEETGMSFSTGVAATDRQTFSPGQLVGAAEAALRMARAQGGNQIEYHA